MGKKKGRKAGVKKEKPENLALLEGFIKECKIPVYDKPDEIVADYLTDKAKRFPGLMKTLKAHDLVKIKLREVLRSIEEQYNGLKSYENYEKIEFLFELSIFLLKHDRSNRFKDMAELNRLAKAFANGDLFLQDCDFVTDKILDVDSEKYVKIADKKKQSVDFETQHAPIIFEIYQLIKTHISTAALEEDDPMRAMTMLCSRAILQSNSEMFGEVVALFLRTELNYKPGQKDDVNLSKLQDFVSARKMKSFANLVLAVDNCESMEFIEFFVKLNESLKINQDEFGTNNVTALHAAIVSLKSVYALCLKSKINGFNPTQEDFATLKMAIKIIKRLTESGARQENIKFDVEVEDFRISQDDVDWAIGVSEIEEDKVDEIVVKYISTLDLEKTGLAKVVAKMHHKNFNSIASTGYPTSILNETSLMEAQKCNPNGIALILSEFKRFELEGVDLSRYEEGVRSYNDNVGQLLHLCAKMCDDAGTVGAILKDNHRFTISDEKSRMIDRTVANGHGFELGSAICGRIAKVKTSLLITKSVDGKTQDKAIASLDSTTRTLRDAIKRLNGDARSLSIQIVTEGILGINTKDLTSNENATLICESLKGSFEYFKTAPCTAFNQYKFLVFLNLLKEIKDAQGNSKRHIVETVAGLYAEAMDAEALQQPPFQKLAQKILKDKTPRELYNTKFFRDSLLYCISNQMYAEVNNFVSRALPDLEDKVFRSDDTILAAINQVALTEEDPAKHDKAIRILARLVDHLDVARGAKAYFLLQEVVSRFGSSRPISALLEVGFISTSQILNFLETKALLDKQELKSFIKELAENYLAPISGTENAIDRAQRAIKYCNNEHLSGILDGLVTSIEAGSSKDIYEDVCAQIVELSKSLNLNFETERLNLVIHCIIANLEKAKDRCPDIDLDTLKQQAVRNILELRPIVEKSIAFTIIRAELSPFVEYGGHPSIFESIFSDELDFQDVTAKTVLLEYFSSSSEIKNQKITDDLALKIVKMIISYASGDAKHILLKNFLDETGYKLPAPDFGSDETCAVKEILLNGYKPLVALARSYCNGAPLDSKLVDRFLNSKTLISNKKRKEISEITSTPKIEEAVKDGRQGVYSKKVAVTKKNRGIGKGDGGRGAAADGDGDTITSSDRAMAAEGPVLRTKVEVVEIDYSKKLEEIERDLLDVSQDLKVSVKGRVKTAALRIQELEESRAREEKVKRRKIEEERRIKLLEEKKIEEERRAKIENLAQRPIRELLDLLTGDEKDLAREAIIHQNTKLLEKVEAVPKITEANHELKEQARVSAARARDSGSQNESLQYENFNLSLQIDRQNTEAKEQESKIQEQELKIQELTHNLKRSNQQNAFLRSELSSLNVKAASLEEQLSTSKEQKSKIRAQLRKEQRENRQSAAANSSPPLAGEAVAVDEVVDVAADVAADAAELELEQKEALARQESAMENAARIADLEGELQRSQESSRQIEQELGESNRANQRLRNLLNDLRRSKSNLEAKFRGFKEGHRAASEFIAPTPAMSGGMPFALPPGVQPPPGAVFIGMSQDVYPVDVGWQQGEAAAAPYYYDPNQQAAAKYHNTGDGAEILDPEQLGEEEQLEDPPTSAEVEESPPVKEADLTESAQSAAIATSTAQVTPSPDPEAASAAAAAAASASQQDSRSNG